MKQNNPYGSTLKCTQGYGAEGPSVAPWVRCVDLALFDSIRETKKLFGLTIKCTQGYEAAGSSVAPRVRCVELASFDATSIHKTKQPLWVVHKMRTRL